MHALDQHVLAAVRLDEVRPQVVPVAEDALGDRDARSAHVDQPRRAPAFWSAAARPARCPSTATSGRRRPGRRACPSPGDRDVLGLEGVDERRVVHQLDAFPAREDDRQVVARVAAEARASPRRPGAD